METKTVYKVYPTWVEELECWMWRFDDKGTMYTSYEIHEFKSEGMNIVKIDIQQSETEL